MTSPVEIKFFFNFRSPYCYIASKRLAEIFDDYNVNLIWRPLGGWDGRSSPDRAKVKVPMARQDLARITRKMGIPMTPPPITTDPTKAAIGSLLAEKKGLLRPYIVEMMRSEWATGLDIGEDDVIAAVGDRIGLDSRELLAFINDPENTMPLTNNWEEAQSLGVIGVPTFVVGDEIFWGADRIDYLLDYLRENRLSVI